MLFDFDGTIAGTTDNKSEIMNRIGKKYGCPIGREDYLNAFRKLVDNRKLDDRVPIFEEIVGDRKIAEKISEEYSMRSLECMRIYPDAEQVLKDLSVKKGLITNGPKEVQWSKIRKLGVEHYFDTIIVSGEVGKSKPDPEIFNIALESLDANPSETIYVGDIPDLDVMGAKNAGLVSALINRDGKSPSVEPDYELDDLRELRSVIE